MLRCETALARKINTLSDQFLLWPSLEMNLMTKSLGEHFPLILSDEREKVIRICQEIAKISDAEICWSTSFQPDLIV